ncbi:STAS/SEC14 domain-containing protein [Massilia sp. CF038]|uniref:STAS/SEC14 domain-containing protein n=1 Tax=Massilia sp. CF038 TaxID=1881045 RepID=UPI00091048FB|nr:STAS/SEC14 domain-containing protein [Massilia sp. CF038]SHH29492.1 hypothetical protein SAMN05428948_3717 [Massilia sp. CF038]
MQLPLNLPLSKTVLADGSLEMTAGEGRFVFLRPRPGTLLVTISGQDSGQFGTAALDEIRMEITRQGTLELLIDASEAVLVTTEVSQEWTRFFSLNRPQLRRVSVLTGSRLIHLTVAIAQHLSQTGNLIQIYSDRALFDAAGAGR